ncbi:MAG TPA: hypothetical protein VGZ93_06380 [Candidatus Methylacidiphilales bacterium]|jgi:hypothetical protein|nr:hypothetical protein [Candidatus Methylacidiphilales bacterium]
MDAIARRRPTDSATAAVLLGFFLAGLGLLPLPAAEKLGMPDLSQDEQTCLPTSTANLIIWFGTHGYPKLIVNGDSRDNNYARTVHAIMAATNATYQFGTRTDAITDGIKKYVRNAGYDCDVEYRGIDWSLVKRPDAVVNYEDGGASGQEMKTPAPFTQNWLRENDDPNKGFILLLAYTKFDPATNAYSDAVNAGHAVTLVNAEPDMLLVHDPAHDDDQPGRKILTPEVLVGGTFQLPGYDAPVSGLLLLSGTLMDAPPDARIMLTGAVCVTMHRASEGSKIIGSALGASNATVAGTGSGAPSSAPATPAAPSSPPTRSWAAWFFDLLFKK